MANPNPQNVPVKFQGVRQLGYRHYYEQADPLQEVIRFGKKVNYELKLTNDEIMQDHLKKMRERMSKNKNDHDTKRKQEKEFLDQIASIERLEQQRKLFSKRTLNEDFKSVNDNIMLKRMMDRELNDVSKKNETYNYFPFVGSELVEQNRASLGH